MLLWTIERKRKKENSHKAACNTLEWLLCRYILCVLSDRYISTISFVREIRRNTHQKFSAYTKCTIRNQRWNLRPLHTNYVTFGKESMLLLYNMKREKSRKRKTHTHTHIPERLRIKTTHYSTIKSFKVTHSYECSSIYAHSTLEQMTVWLLIFGLSG